MNGVWASEFLESPPAPGFDPEATVDLDAARSVAGEPLFPVTGITQIAVAYDNTSKTRALFEINKGSNTDPSIQVNATMRHEDRRVPFQHMIYIADGPSDVPAFSVMRHNQGIGYAVYDPAEPGQPEAGGPPAPGRPHRPFRPRRLPPRQPHQRLADPAGGPDRRAHRCGAEDRPEGTGRRSAAAPAPWINLSSLEDV